MGKFLVVILVAVIAFAGLGIASYNSLVGLDEKVDASWSEVQNMYKRRFDLIPQLVETVKGAADFERSTITEVTEARASVGKLTLPEGAPTDQAQLDQYIEAQSRLGQSLGRLLVVAEQYPDLRATEAFRDLQNQLEGTENRIAVARNDYIDTVRAFNTRVRRFPANVIAGAFGFEHKPQMSFETDVERVPEIDFTTGD